ncbi:hypothetical protein AB670_03310 [Chryseobacterium sp. MOF25P]|uniref:DUF4919 domain-containing protein n=1 Tax=unclassified Chryseobacterium TaxID=2593645 RepID=UPI000804EDF3|nr:MULTISPECIES: DUF4919 domain-containing protein [unclassified Chryseobacterium]OBW40358.1 hypothetical protein AB670_03310 [Chryseobacterium sp. MOF25P]OBW43748.1 hypothetical protein AB671_04171 [Chryseobacterium sp. BGARF1]
MLKHFLFFSFVFISNFVSSQTKEYEAPDYKIIQKNIENKDSEFYYPKLLDKLKANDTLITNDQYRHLYFGYTFLKEYHPYKISENDKKLIPYFQSKDLKKSDYAEIIKISNASLKEFPLNLRVMNFLGYIYHLDGNEAMANKVSHNFYGLFGAIYSSGDGKDCKTGFHVISVSHEYVVMNMLELEIASQGLSGDCDYLSLPKDKYKLPGVYFNITKLKEKGFDF